MRVVYEVPLYRASENALEQSRALQFSSSQHHVHISSSSRVASTSGLTARCRQAVFEGRHGSHQQHSWPDESEWSIEYTRTGNSIHRSRQFKTLSKTSCRAIGRFGGTMAWKFSSGMRAPNRDENGCHELVPRAMNWHEFSPHEAVNCPPSTSCTYVQ